MREEKHLNGHKGKSGQASFKQWRKETSNHVADALKPSSNPEEADVFEAKKALQTGKEQPVANYLRDLAERLRRRAPHAGTKVFPLKRRRVAVATGKAIPWNHGDLQVEEAFEQGNEELLASFDRDAVLLEHLAAALDGAPGSWGWRLNFKRSRRGRPSDVAKVFHHSRISTDLKSEILRAGEGKGPGKQDSAIHALKQERGISRSTVMRVKARRKGKHKSH
jgi:hypothetical protein